jgi:hypothetical protein
LEDHHHVLPNNPEAKICQSETIPEYRNGKSMWKVISNDYNNLIPKPENGH